MENETVQTGGLTHSPSIGQLAAALAEAHKKFKPLKKDTINPFFKSKYADLAAVIESTEEGLSANGLAILQPPISVENGRVTITTMLIHSSGEWIRADLPMPVEKANAQGIGSSLTYARRYAYQAFVSVAAEMDDDGNAASGKDKEAREATMPKPPARKNGADADPGATFGKLFWAKCKSAGKTEACVREYIGSIGYESTTEIPPAQQSAALAWAEGRDA